MSDKFVLGCIKGFKIPFAQTPKQSSLPRNQNWSQEETVAWRLEISRLLEIGAINPYQSVVGEFLCSYFLVSKPDYFKPFIFNLQQLNDFIDVKGKVLNGSSELCSIKLCKKLLHFFYRKENILKCTSVKLCTSVKYSRVKFVKVVVFVPI